MARPNENNTRAIDTTVNREISLFFYKGNLMEEKEKLFAEQRNLKNKSKALPVEEKIENLEDMQAEEVLLVIDAWIRDQLGKTLFINEKDFVTKRLWANKNSSHIKNLGRVIGHTYHFSEISEKPIASYRIDWDPVKGKHFNITICVPDLMGCRSAPNNGKFVVQFGNLANDKIEHEEMGKPYGELQVIASSLVMTKQALEANDEMPKDIARKLMQLHRISIEVDSSREKDEARAYLNSFGEDLLPSILEAANKIESHESNQTIENISNNIQNNNELSIKKAFEETSSHQADQQNGSTSLNEEGSNEAEDEATAKATRRKKNEVKKRHKPTKKEKPEPRGFYASSFFADLEKLKKEPVQPQPKEEEVSCCSQLSSFIGSFFKPSPMIIKIDNKQPCIISMKVD